MIKVPYSISKLDDMAADFYSTIKSEFQISKVIRNRPVDELSPVLGYILRNLKTIVTGRPKNLEVVASILKSRIESAKIVYRANRKVNEKEAAKWSKRELLKIFNYDYDDQSFTKRDGGDIAYKHALNLNLTTCLYCNAQFTFSKKTKLYKFRPHFDHFFPKSKHPYLALSFYNLIPACTVCNSNLKGSKDFKFSTHIHPFIESFESEYQFRTNVTTVDFVVNKKNFTISLEKKIGSTNTLTVKAAKNIEVFAIDDRYNFHKDYASEIIKRSHVYSNKMITDMVKNTTVHGVALFNSPSEIVELLMGNFMTPGGLHKRILAKLTKDIAEEFGIRI